jgi:uncharacterized membrane protein YphA (DoxX/SURF4 family)
MRYLFLRLTPQCEAPLAVHRHDGAIALLVLRRESVGALALIVGFMTRCVAASIAVIMGGAIAMVHWEHGFFMNWFGQQAGEGFEYHVLMIGMCVALMLSGGGKWSMDQKVQHVSTEEDQKFSSGTNGKVSTQR